ncbi:MAG: heat-shock protein Hsp20 [Candidatus Altiarchaeales archaeon ex4484_96]|nr:MAG: heat-shock protein Hsp20 [Candidatus Altiarchaeales archaeon ex4484_96]
MDPWRRKKRPFNNNELFRELEKEFKEMEKRLNKLFTDITDIEAEMIENEPYIYGFSIRSGPEGKPIINEFGNIINQELTKDTAVDREPLIDLIEGEKMLTVVAEVPGVEEKDINIGIEDNHLIIDVDSVNRRYYKKLKLPAEVDEKNIKYTHKNGILEVKLDKRL